MKMIKLQLVKKMIEANKEAIQEDLGNVKLEDVQHVLLKFGLCAIEAYEGLFELVEKLMDRCDNEEKGEIPDPFEKNIGTNSVSKSENFRDDRLVYII